MSNIVKALSQNTHTHFVPWVNINAIFISHYLRPNQIKNIESMSNFTTFLFSLIRIDNCSCVCVWACAWNKLRVGRERESEKKMWQSNEIEDGMRHSTFKISINYDDWTQTHQLPCHWISFDFFLVVSSVSVSAFCMFQPYSIVVVVAVFFFAMSNRTTIQ